MKGLPYVSGSHILRYMRQSEHSSSSVPGKDEHIIQCQLTSHRSQSMFCHQFIVGLSSFFDGWAQCNTWFASHEGRSLHTWPRKSKHPLQIINDTGKHPDCFLTSLFGKAATTNTNCPSQAIWVKSIQPLLLAYFQVPSFTSVKQLDRTLEWLNQSLSLWENFLLF